MEVEVDGWAPERAVGEDEEHALLREDPALPSLPTDRRASLKRETVGIFQVLVHPQYYRATIAVIMVMIAQQLCGINSIVMYGVRLLKDILSTSSALLRCVRCGNQPYRDNTLCSTHRQARSRNPV